MTATQDYYSGWWPSVDTSWGKVIFRSWVSLADGKMMKRSPRLKQEITKLCKPAGCINKHRGSELLWDLHIPFLQCLWGIALLQEQTSPAGMITCVSALNHPAQCSANPGHVESPMALGVAQQDQSCIGKTVSRGTNKVQPGEMLAKIRSVTCWCHAELHFPPQEGVQWHWGLSLALDGVLQVGHVELHVHKQCPGNPNKRCSYPVLG